MKTNFIDLGLPSGRLWAAENEPGYHQFDKAVEKFGDQLPSIEAWKELFEKCDHTWDKKRKGYVITGPNGNSIFLPANGWQHWNIKTKDLKGGRVWYIGGRGLYWSSSPDGVDYARNVHFWSDYVDQQGFDLRLNGFSIRLCKSK